MPLSFPSDFALTVAAEAEAFPELVATLQAPWLNYADVAEAQNMQQKMVWPRSQRASRSRPSTWKPDMTNTR